LSACGGSSSITEPSNLNGQKAYFAFDSAMISQNARDNLLGQALYMKNHPSTKVRIEGNCDERGTHEYNIALGYRRAEASKSVIVRDGVAADRITVISNGKTKPAVLGTGEEVWKWNRNSTTTVQ